MNQQQVQKREVKRKKLYSNMPKDVSVVNAKLSREGRIKKLSHILASFFGMNSPMDSKKKNPDRMKCNWQFQRNLIWLGLTKDDIPEAMPLAKEIIAKRATDFASGKPMKSVKDL